MHNYTKSFITDARQGSNDLLASNPFNSNLQISEHIQAQVNKNNKITSTSHSVVIYSTDQKKPFSAKTSPEPAKQAKTRLLNTICHEIMTPLTNIIGFSDLLVDVDMSSTQKEQTRHIINASLQLQNLLNEVLAFAELNPEDVNIEHLPFLATSLLSQISEHIIKTAQGKGVSVNVAIDPQLPALLGDERLLNHALNILAANAVKFTRQGRINLNAQLLDAQEGRVHVVFSVTDTGIGIPMYRQNEISQALTPSNSYKPNGMGMGLGLIICARLVKLLGGDLSFESQFGTGSQFRISLWLEIDLT